MDLIFSERACFHLIKICDACSNICSFSFIIFYTVHAIVIATMITLSDYIQILTNCFQFVVKRFGVLTVLFEHLLVNIISFCSC
jgi:hypothetical protein